MKCCISTCKLYSEKHRNATESISFHRYFIALVLQFQFHRSLCELSGRYSPDDPDSLLSNCDIYSSDEAGVALSKMLQMGSSKPWPDALEVLTGQRHMDASGLLEYFEPLYEWLKAENERTGEYIGWKSSYAEYCTEEQQRDVMSNKEFSKVLKKLRN